MLWSHCASSTFSFGCTLFRPFTDFYWTDWGLKLNKKTFYLLCFFESHSELEQGSICKIYSTTTCVFVPRMSGVTCTSLSKEGCVDVGHIGFCVTWPLHGPGFGKILNPPLVETELVGSWRSPGNSYQDITFIVEVFRGKTGHVFSYLSAASRAETPYHHLIPPCLLVHNRVMCH